jgi:S-adenosylmethionine-diacylglycerol 3-amino-3-carboxypropyl transferase
MLLRSPIKDSISWDEVRYSQVWEDSLRLRRALQILPTDHVLSIGSAGCNALEMLLDNPRKISVIDLSRAQHALLDLKFTAISTLDFDLFTSLLGIDSHLNPVSIYQTIRTRLLLSTQQYFDSNIHLIEMGLIHQGRLEKYFKLFRETGLRQLWSPIFISELTECESLSDQLSLLRDHGKLENLSLLASQFFDRSGLEKARDPGQMIFVNESQMGQILFLRFLNVIQHQLISTNPYLIYFLTGEMPTEDRRLAIFKKRNYSTLQNRIHRIELCHIDLESFLGSAADQSLQKLNLSDVFEYLSPEHCQNVFALISQKLAPKARLAYWSLFVDRVPLSDHFERIENNDSDRVWFYKDFSIYERK